MSITRKILKDKVEPLLSNTFGRFLWPPVSVAVLAHGEHQDILVIENDSGHQLPGGIVESGEDLRSAAQREVLEETGYNVRIKNLLEVRTRKGFNPGITFYFEADVIDGENSGSWEGNPKFVDEEEVKDIEWELEHSHVHEYLFPE